MRNLIIICLIVYILINVYGLDANAILNYIVDLVDKIIQLIATIILSI